MPWQVTTVEDERLRLVEAVEDGCQLDGQPMSFTAL